MSGRAVLATALLLSGCGDGSETATPSGHPSAPTPAATSAAPSPTPVALKECAHPTERYTVSFPSDWFVAEEEGIEPCAFFDPSPLDLEPATEADGVAVRVDLLADGLDEARVRTGSQDAPERTVNGRRAVRYEGETDDQGLQPAGLAYTTWLVDLGDRTLLLTTDEGGEDDYHAAVEVLDEMAARVETS